MRLAIFCLLMGLGSFGFASSKYQKMVKDSGIPEEHFGILIQKGSEEKPIYGLNQDQQFIPASLTKLITAFVVLDEFPSGHQFVTELRSAASVSKSTLEGDLYLVGDGDPGFVSESMWNLVNNFVRTGVKKIDGDLYVDSSKFDQIKFDPSRSKKRVDRAYDSPVGAMSFNWNAVNIYVRPGKPNGSPVKVFIDPENEYFEVVNKATTGSGTKNSIDINLESIKGESGAKERITITGTYGRALKEKVYFKAVDDPAIWSLSNLKSFLRRRGIEVTGQLKVGSPPMSAREMASWKSHPLSYHVAGMMKYSNNYIAEMLIKNLAAHKGVRPASLESGVGFLKKYLDENKMGEYALANPSGLSRENKFTPSFFVKLLTQATRSSRLGPEFLAALPRAGVDGTLKSRMTGLKKKGELRAKTGMLNGVSGLAGVAGDNHEVVFSFVYNGPHKSLYKARDLFDKMAVELNKDF